MAATTLVRGLCGVRIFSPSNIECAIPHVPLLTVAVLFSFFFFLLISPIVRAGCWRVRHCRVPSAKCRLSFLSIHLSSHYVSIPLVRLPAFPPLSLSLLHCAFSCGRYGAIIIHMILFISFYVFQPCTRHCVVSLLQCMERRGKAVPTTEPHSRNLNQTICSTRFHTFCYTCIRISFGSWLCHGNVEREACERTPFAR